MRPALGDQSRICDRLDARAVAGRIAIPPARHDPKVRAAVGPGRVDSFRKYLGGSIACLDSFWSLRFNHVLVRPHPEQDRPHVETPLRWTAVSRLFTSTQEGPPSPTAPETNQGLLANLGADGRPDDAVDHALGEPSGGDWDVASNWVNQANSADHHVPTSSDDAEINYTGSRSLSPPGPDSVQSLTSRAVTFTLSGGTLTVTGTVQVSSGSTLSLQGRTPADAT